MGKKQLSDQNWKTHTHPQWSRNAPGLIDQSISSVAILAEISENARNLKLIADGNFRTIGHEIMAKNARNFTFGQKEPEIARNLAKLAKIMPILTCLSFMIFQFFFVHKDPEFEFYFLQYFSLQFQRLA